MKRKNEEKAGKRRGEERREERREERGRWGRERKVGRENKNEKRKEGIITSKLPVWITSCI